MTMLVIVGGLVVTRGGPSWRSVPADIGGLAAEFAEPQRAPTSLVRDSAIEPNLANSHAPRASVDPAQETVGQ